MKKLLCLLVILCASFIACSKTIAEKESSNQIISGSPQSANTNKDNSVVNNSSAGFPDFENFKYPNLCIEGDTKPFLLKNGSLKDTVNKTEIIFSGVNYADVTGDGSKEAFVVLDLVTGGTMLPNCVYIFTLQDAKNKKVKKLWDFYTGDRANGGLRNIYGNNGNLIVERYAPEGKSGDCCPKYYIKETYKWDKEEFKKQSEEKTLNPANNAELILNSN